MSCVLFFPASAGLPLRPLATRPFSCPVDGNGPLVVVPGNSFRVPAGVAPGGTATWLALVERVAAMAPAPPVTICISARELIFSVAALKLEAKLGGETSVGSAADGIAVAAAATVPKVTIGALGTRLVARQLRKIPAIEEEFELSAAPFVLAGALAGVGGPSEADPDIP
jgi:hypothetical protein